jgi:FHA domain
VDTAELTLLTRTLTKDEFLAHFPHLFLLLERADDSGRLQFHTEIVDAKKGLPSRPSGTNLVPLVKAPGSPYSERISIGRARNCDVVLRDPSVSKLHAHVRREADGSSSLVDLGSQNGTLLDGVKVAPSQPVPIKPGSFVTLGRMTGRILDAAMLHRLLSNQIR